MYLLGEQPAYADAWVNHLQTLPARLLAGLAPSGAALNLEPCADLAPHLAAGTVYWVESGLIHGRLNDRALFHVQDGDLLNLDATPAQIPLSWYCDGPLVLVPYSRPALLAHLANAGLLALLIEYQQGQALLLADAVTRLKQPEYRSSNGFKRVAPGEMLIRQGDAADHVFIITEGHAEAFVDGQKVGDVPKDEIFGAMAVFTDEKRSATVVASTPCTVMIIPKEQFLGMTQTNPRIAHSLIESMAKKIDTLNKQLTRHEEGSR
ncbi:cyclic nucleotide-binding domain-containing protein [Pseudomonas sp. NPDC007930]|uniref:Crp/Fnr family transcriptional regulator n=1 Tax=Pseudomonas sp. NPDC007930 TaxID=3364417 RepID=UPI0036E2DD5B